MTTDKTGAEVHIRAEDRRYTIAVAGEDRRLRRFR